MNESDQVIPKTDFANHAEGSSPKHIKSEMVALDATENTCDATQDTTATNPKDQPGQLQCYPNSETTPVFFETELATTVASLISEYRDLNDEINDITSLAVDQSAKLEKTKEKLLPRLAAMQSVLSERGELHRRLKSNELPPEITEKLLAQINALPGWSEWYEDYRVRVKDAASLRTVQRQLAELNRMSLPKHTDCGENSDGTMSGEGAEESDSTADGSGQPDDVAPGTKDSEREEIKSGQELLTEHAKEMVEVLTGRSVKNDAMRITRALTKLKDLQQAIDEGKLFGPPFPIVEPQSVPAPVPPSSQPLSLPKPGDCSGLVAIVSRLCGEHLKAALKELDPEVMADVYGRFVESLAKMYCQNSSDGAVKMKVTVEHVSRRAKRVA